MEQNRGDCAHALEAAVIPQILADCTDLRLDFLERIGIFRVTFVISRLDEQAQLASDLVVARDIQPQRFAPAWQHCFAALLTHVGESVSFNKRNGPGSGAVSCGTDSAAGEPANPGPWPGCMRT